MERKSRKIKNLRNFFDGSSFQQRALYYYLVEFFKDYPFVKVNYRNSSSGMEFDITVTVEFVEGETNVEFAIEYDGSFWHQNLDKDLEKNRFAVANAIKLLRIREKYCPKMVDDTIRIIERTTVKSMKELETRIIESIEWILDTLENESVLSKYMHKKLVLKKLDYTDHQKINTIRDKETINLIVPQKNQDENIKEIINMERELIRVAKENIDFFTTTTQWDSFAQKNNVYMSHYYVHYFGTWNNALEIVGQISINELKKKAAIRQGIETIDYVDSYANYKSYLQKLNNENYMSVNAIVNIFGSWNEFKKELGLSTYKQAKQYNKEELLRIAKENKEIFKQSAYYDKVARQSGLPSQFVYIRAFGSMDAAKEKIGIEISDRNTRNNWSEDQLIYIARKYSEYFTTFSAWLSFSNKINKIEGEKIIPSPYTYKNRFGSWGKSKERIFG